MNRRGLTLQPLGLTRMHLLGGQTETLKVSYLRFCDAIRWLLVLLAFVFVFLLSVMLVKSLHFVSLKM